MKEYEKPQMEIIELSGAGVFTDPVNHSMIPCDADVPQGGGEGDGGFD